jgi:hypothetical protein
MLYASFLTAFTGSSYKLKGISMIKFNLTIHWDKCQTVLLIIMYFCNFDWYEDFLIDYSVPAFEKG